MFEAFNIVFYLQHGYRSFFLFSFVFLRRGFRAQFQEVYDILVCNQSPPKRIWMESDNYLFLTNIFQISEQETKDLERTIVCIFDINIDTNFFTTPL